MVLIEIMPCSDKLEALKIERTHYEELKQKLRDGKQKRLQEVRKEMKFILDSDDVKDSNGK